MKTSEILIEAKKLIEKPKNWTKGSRARVRTFDYRGVSVEPFHPLANCFCAVGAIQKVKNCDSDLAYKCEEVKLLGECLPAKFGSELIWSFNDDFKTTHEQIITVFDKAIKKAKVQEQKTEESL